MASPDGASPDRRPSAASLLEPPDESSDSVAFAGISLTRTVPSSSPRPAPVTGAAARSIQHYGAAQHGVHDHSTVPMLFGPHRENTSSLLTSGHAVESPRSTTVMDGYRSRGTTRARNPCELPCGTSPGDREFAPHRLPVRPGPVPPAAGGAGQELESAPALVVEADVACARRFGDRVGHLEEQHPVRAGGLRHTPTGPVACRRALVTSSLTSSSARSVTPSSSHRRSCSRTARRAARTAFRSAGKVHVARSPSVSVTRITSPPSESGSPTVSGFMWSIATYPISRTEYRAQRREARTVRAVVCRRRAHTSSSSRRCA